MLTELHIENLGVIERVELVLGPGLTAVTGETGAGKTMIVEAIELLVGGRADATMVRVGAGEARVDGRFVVGDEPGNEIVLTRVVPADGRSGVRSTGAWRRRAHSARSPNASSTCTASTPIRACWERRPNAPRSTTMPRSTWHRCRGGARRR